MIPIAQVIKITEFNYVVKCPYCNKNHYHGKQEGEKVSHCFIPLRSKKLKLQVEERKAFYNSNEYYVKI
jgi:hypothetical protein